LGEGPHQCEREKEVKIDYSAREEKFVCPTLRPIARGGVLQGHKENRGGPRFLFPQGVRRIKEKRQRKLPYPRKRKREEKTSILFSRRRGKRRTRGKEGGREATSQSNYTDGGGEA